MDYQNDLDRVRTRYTESQQKYYKEKNLKKTFNLNDKQIALNEYSAKYNIHPMNLSEQQKLTAISEYKTGKDIFLEGANDFSGFLYENYAIGSPEVEVAKKIDNEKKGFFQKTWGTIKSAVSGNLVPNDIKHNIVSNIARVSDEKGNMTTIDSILVGTDIALSQMKGVLGSDNDDKKISGLKIISAIYRGVGGLITMGGSALTEAWESKNYKANKTIESMEMKDGFLEDYTRWNELNSMSKLVGDGWNKELATEYRSLSDKYNATELTAYKQAKAYVNKDKHTLKVLGKSIEAIGSTIEGLEGLNNEYTKAYKEGKITYDEWFNIGGVTFSNSLRDPNFWLNQAPEVVGQVGGLIALTTLTPGVPDEYAVAGYVIDGLPINLMFSASESNQVRNEARDAGYSEDEAQEMASKTFAANIVVQGVLGAAPGAVTKLANKTKAYQKFISTNYAQRIIGRVTTVGIDAMFEGIEEVLQDQIRDSHLNKDYKFMAEVSAETFILGAIGGLFGGVGMITQEVAFNKTYTSMMEDESISPFMKNYEKQALSEGKTKLEAKDYAMSQMNEVLNGTAKSQDMIKLENKHIQEALIEKAIKPAKDIQAQESKIKSEALKQSSVEERNSKIDNFTYKYDDATKERTIQGPSQSSQVDDKTAIGNMVAKQVVKKYDDINFNEQENLYTSKNRMTKFAKEVNDRVEKLTNLNNKVKNLNENLDASGVRGYIKRNDLKMDDIHDLQANKAMTTTQYINAMRKLKQTARDSNIESKIQLGNRLNGMVDNFDNISLSEYNKLADDIKKEFTTTLSNGLKQLTEMGSITANDAATFKNQAKVFKQEAAEDTKKQLEAATKTIEKQKESETKIKETNKQLKKDNQQMTLDLGEQKVPQRVKTLKEVKADKTIGKTTEQKTLIKLVEAKTKKEVKEISEFKEEVKPKKEPSPLVKYLKARNFNSNGVAINYGKGVIEDGMYGDAYYFNSKKIKLESSNPNMRNYIDFTKLNMFIPKDAAEARNYSNMLETYNLLMNTDKENELEEYNRIHEDFKTFSDELKISSNKIESIINKEQNLIEGLGYKGIDFRSYQKDTNKYQSAIYGEVDMVKGKDIVKYINEEKEKENIKTNLIKEIC